MSESCFARNVLSESVNVGLTLTHHPSQTTGPTTTPTPRALFPLTRTQLHWVGHGHIIPAQPQALRGQRANSHPFLSSWQPRPCTGGAQP